MTEERPEPEMLILVDTPAGEFVRAIAPRVPLSDGALPGTAAELATRSAAETWGLPDFVYCPALRRKGAANRELSDGVLLCGNAGVVVQVKHRAAPSGEESREQAWLAKKAAEAISQLNGTLRSLASERPTLVNGRDRSINVPDGVDWCGVVILDHPSPPRGVEIGTAQASVPTLVLLRRDWEFLFQQLRSTHAVVSYVRRAADDGAVTLGEEPVRYYELADADESAPPNPSEAARIGGGKAVTVPLLPKAPAGYEDTAGHLLIRAVMEDIALSEAEFTEEQRLEVLAEIDGLPVAARASLGRHVMTQLEGVTQAPAGSFAWGFRLCRFEPPKPQLMFGVCNALTEESREAFRLWVMLRHHEFTTALERVDINSVAVLLTPRGDGTRPWDTTMFSVRGDLGLTDEDLDGARQLWSRNQSWPDSGALPWQAG